MDSLIPDAAREVIDLVTPERLSVLGKVVDAIFPSRSAHRWVKDDRIRRLGEAQTDIEVFAALEAAGLTYNELGVLVKALPMLKNPQPDAVSDDWVVNAVDKARLSSDDETQAAWALLLAGEFDNPGSYSRKTVNILSDMSKDDADAFSTLCRFVVSGYPMVLRFDDEVYVREGLTESVCSKLESLSLLSTSTLGFTGIEVPAGKNLGLLYFGNVFTVLNPASKEVWQPYFGHVGFTPWGKELSALVNASPVDGFPEYVAKTMPLGMG